MKIVQLMRSIAFAHSVLLNGREDGDCPLLSPTHNTGDRAATVVLLLSEEDGQMQRQWRLNGRSEDRDRAHCE